MSSVQGNDRLEGEVASESGSTDVSATPAKRTPKDSGSTDISAAPAKRTRKVSDSTDVSAAPAKRTRKVSGSKSPGGTRATKQTEEPASSKDDAPSVAEVPAPQRLRLLELYHSEVVPTMMQEFGYHNIMQVPRLKKVVVNIGLGEALTNPKAMESATRDLATICGQKPIVTRAKNSIAGFKLRQGNPIGVCVTMRGVRMYEFMDRLLNAALPRIRDFRGLSPKSFDGRGNYSLGIREQIIFPEIDYGQIERIRGFQVTITTTSKTDGEAARLLTILGMPFAGQN